MSGPLSDCYVMSTTRSAAWATQFLDHFVPNRGLACEPTDPGEVLGMDELEPGEPTILQFLESDPKRPYLMYFRNLSDDKIRFAILSYNEDGTLIVGLSSTGEDGSESLQALEAFSGTRGYWSVEEAPQSSRGEFLQRLKEDDL